MNERWNQLSLREKILVGGGASVTILILFYVLVWSPFVDKIHDLQISNVSEQKLLNWMRTEAPRLEQMRNAQKSIPAMSQARTLLATVGDSLKLGKKTLDSNDIKEGDNKSVIVHFKQAPFNDFISWYQQLIQRNPVDSQDMTIRALDEPGMVEATITLRKTQ